MSLAVIEIIDLFLIGTVACIAAVGLYKLFISDSDVALPMWLTINTLKDLEDKIIGVIVAALAVAFLGHAAGVEEPTALLSYGGRYRTRHRGVGVLYPLGRQRQKPIKR